MSRKVLFSPIGGTDPIKYMRDGSMLHICRHYKPDIVYLYLSHEMMEYHRKDNRYVDAIERLGTHLGHEFDVCLIERDELINVQQYDVFYHDFREEIIQIEKDMEEGDELLLNMASGTPAMKSALLVMATFAEYRFKPIQVSTPVKGMNDKFDDRKEYETELYWELNEDNEEDAENRCTEVKSLNLMKMIKMEIIKKHVMAYDYVAALTVASEMKNDLSEDAYALLRIMEARVKSDHRTVSRLLADKKYDIYPVQENDKQKVFEYMLVLQMKLKKQEYADFIRGITPLTVDLLEDILWKKCRIRLEECCVKRNNVWKWDRNKLKHVGLTEILEKAYQDTDGGFRYGPVYSTHIAKIIEQKCPDAELVQQINEMVRIEGAVRNVAAHEIVSVTDEWIQARTRSGNKAGKKAWEIFEIIKYIMKEAGITAKKEDWQSYDRVNQRIIQELR